MPLINFFFVFLGFDNTCDLSAVLGIQANASVFPALIQNNAKDVRTEVRNEWGHCNFDKWTESKFSKCFQLMETLVRSLGLPPGDTTKVLGDLVDWEKKGTYFVRTLECLSPSHFRPLSPKQLGRKTQ